MFRLSWPDVSIIQIDGCPTNQNRLCQKNWHSDLGTLCGQLSSYRQSIRVLRPFHRPLAIFPSTWRPARPPAAAVASAACRLPVNPARSSPRSPILFGDRRHTKSLTVGLPLLVAGDRYGKKITILSRTHCFNEEVEPARQLGVLNPRLAARHPSFNLEMSNT
jgi:hypothetical protein